jgi:glycosyltransferase involved in cell wall biosynthesis
LLPRPDYLLVESPPLLLGLSGYWLSRLKATRLIFNVADLWPESGVALGVLRRGSFAYRVGEWLERFCYGKSWMVVGQSATILQDVQRRFPGVPLFHLSNGVDTSRFSPAGKSAAARAALCSNGHFLVVYAGLHGLAQGLEQVLEAAEALKSEDGVQFTLVGDGPCKRELQQHARRRGLSHVRFLDPQPADQVPALLASADALLVPMKGVIHGMVPVKLYEAMGSGRPLVLMGNGEAAQVVREAKVGMVVEPGDISGIVAALRRLQGDSRLAQTMGENGRQAAVERFDRNRIARNFVSFLEERLQA